MSYELDIDTRRQLNTLAREQLKFKLLADIRIDLQICEIEGWDKKEYLQQIRDIIDEIGENL